MKNKKLKKEVRIGSGMKLKFETYLESGVCSLTVYKRSFLGVGPWVKVAYGWDFNGQYVSIMEFINDWQKYYSGRRL